MANDLTFEPHSPRPGDWSQTFTGKRIYVLDMKPEDVDLIDVATALSNKCRYNGYTGRLIADPARRFYSVAEHSVLLAAYTAAVLHRPAQDAMHALLHDATEAYWIDVPRPIKMSLPILKDIEDRLDQVILPALGIPVEKPEWLEQIDKRIVKDEKLALMGPPADGTPWGGGFDELEPLGVEIRTWPPHVAKNTFLAAHRMLSERIKLEGSREPAKGEDNE